QRRDVTFAFAPRVPIPLKPRRRELNHVKRRKRHQQDDVAYHGVSPRAGSPNSEQRAGQRSEGSERGVYDRHAGDKQNREREAPPTGAYSAGLRRSRLSSDETQMDRNRRIDARREADEQSGAESDRIGHQ